MIFIVYPAHEAPCFFAALVEERPEFPMQGDCPRGIVFRFGDVEKVFLEIDVLPFEAHGFADTQAGVESEICNQTDGVVVEAAHYLFYFRVAERADLPLLNVFNADNFRHRVGAD